MVFILDSSRSVEETNFQTMLEFLRDLVDHLDIGSDMIRVGVEKYSHTANTEFNLHDYFDKNSLKDGIMNIQYTRGASNTSWSSIFSVWF